MKRVAYHTFAYSTRFLIKLYLVLLYNVEFCRHYFRHNYASRVLLLWLEEGKDLNAWLTYLSAYMGHDNLRAIFYYINLLPEAFLIPCIGNILIF